MHTINGPHDVIFAIKRVRGHPHTPPMYWTIFAYNDARASELTTPELSPLDSAHVSNTSFYAHSQGVYFESLVHSTVHEMERNVENEV